MIELTDEPVSCVITDKTIYLSPVSCGTLKRGGKAFVGNVSICEESIAFGEEHGYKLHSRTTKS